MKAKAKALTKYQAQMQYWGGILDMVRELGITETDSKFWHQLQPCLTGNVQGWAKMNMATRGLRMSVHRCSVQPAECPRCTSADRILGRRRREYIDVVQEAAFRISADQFYLVLADYSDPVRVPSGKRVHRVLGDISDRRRPCIDGPLWCAEIWCGATFATKKQKKSGPGSTAIAKDAYLTDIYTGGSGPGYRAEGMLEGEIGDQPTPSNPTSAQASAQVSAIGDWRLAAISTGYLLMLGPDTSLDQNRLQTLLRSGGAEGIRILPQDSLTDAWAAYNLAYSRCQWDGLGAEELAAAYLHRRRKPLRCWVKIGPGFQGNITADRGRNVQSVGTPEVTLAACSNKMLKSAHLRNVRSRLAEYGIPESEAGEILKQFEGLLDAKIYKLDADKAGLHATHTNDQGEIEMAKTLDAVLNKFREDLRKDMKELTDAQVNRIMDGIKNIEKDSALSASTAVTAIARTYDESNRNKGRLRRKDSEGQIQ